MDIPLYLLSHSHPISGLDTAAYVVTDNAICSYLYNRIMAELLQ